MEILNGGGYGGGTYEGGTGGGGLAPEDENGPDYDPGNGELWGGGAIYWSEDQTKMLSVAVLAGLILHYVGKK